MQIGEVFMNKEFHEVVVVHLSICLGYIQKSVKDTLGLLIRPGF
jgi:hypothetical protein